MNLDPAAIWAWLIDHRYTIFAAAPFIIAFLIVRSAR